MKSSQQKTTDDRLHKTLDATQVAKLDSSHLIEWVNSPARIRPFLLLQWSTENSKQDNPIPSSNKPGDQSSSRQTDEDYEVESNRLKKVAELVSRLWFSDFLLDIITPILFFFSIISIGIYSGNYFSWLIVSERDPSKALGFRLFMIVGTCILFFSVGKGMKGKLFRNDFMPFMALFSMVGLLVGFFVGISGGDYGVLVLPGFYIELGPHILGSSVGCIIGTFLGFLIDLAVGD